MRTVQFFTALTLYYSTFAYNLHYDSTNHYYDDLLVSISPDVPETDSAKTISNIKLWLEEGSKSLYAASHGWAHFKNVYILVPASWSPVPGATPAHQVHEDAQIRVEPTHSIYGDSPFTVQTGECGEEGEYIQITENYLNRDVETPDSVFGPSGQVFVYEWSKFKYGVFEEHGYPGDPLYPMFYSEQSFTLSETSLTGSLVKPNLCTNEDSTGMMKNFNGDPCSIEANGMPSDDCIFIVDGPSSLNSSVMSVPYFPGIDHWSDKTEEGFYQCDLPTKHNTMCNGKSVSDVVRQSPDFAGYQPDITEELDTTPKFTILQPGSLSGSFVFVLDYSGSMFGNTERAARMKKGIERFMKLDVDFEKKHSFGVAAFGSSAYIREPIIPISDASSRDKIIKTVNDQGSMGLTCLHLGIRKGLEALRNSGKSSGGTSIFLTDGRYGCGSGSRDWLGAVSSEVLAQDVRHCTIAFSDYADPDLEELARRTNGKAFFVPDNSGPEYINNAIAGCLEFLPSVPTKEKDSALIQQSYQNVASISETITIDQSCGKDVKIQIDFKVQGSYTIRITSIAGNQTKAFSGEDSLEMSFPSISSNSDLSLNIESTSNSGKIDFLTILVKCKAQEDTDPITMDCWTNAGQADVIMEGNDPDKLVIYGKAMQGSSPIFDAAFRAIITSDVEDLNSRFEGGDPDKPILDARFQERAEHAVGDELVLRDDGAAPDNIKNDGIYSAYYLPTDKLSSAEARYSLTCKIIGTYQTSVVNLTLSEDIIGEKRSFFGRASQLRPSSPLCCGSVAIKDGTPTSPTGVFTRTASGGVITIKGKIDSNIYPPAPIRDLILTDDVYGDTFNLSFTLPGEDLNSGTISEYLIFYSENRTMLEVLNPSNPSNLSTLTEEMLDCTNCTFDPLPALSKVMLTIKKVYFEKNVPYSFRVLAVDKGDKNSYSNLVGYVANPTIQEPKEGTTNFWESFYGGKCSIDTDCVDVIAYCELDVNPPECRPGLVFWLICSVALFLLALCLICCIVRACIKK